MPYADMAGRGGKLVTGDTTDSRRQIVRNVATGTRQRVPNLQTIMRAQGADIDDSSTSPRRLPRVGSLGDSPRSRSRSRSREPELLGAGVPSSDVELQMSARSTATPATESYAM
jgi:hypothetical protein